MKPPILLVEAPYGFLIKILDFSSSIFFYCSDYGLRRFTRFLPTVLGVMVLLVGFE